LKTLANDPLIIAAYRTAIGKYGGILSSIRPDDMLASLMNESIKKSSINPDDIDEVVIGCANQAGEDNRNIARMATLLASLKHTIPAITLNRLCASGLDAVIDGARRIITGEAQLVLTGGVESMSRSPYVMAKAQAPWKLGAPDIFDTSLGWRFFNEKMRERTPPEHNGITAERLAKEYSISRARQDYFALSSHQKAVEAQKRDFFDEEIIPLDGPAHKEPVKKDEGPRLDTSFEKLSSLKPAFLPDGSVTAGNSSSLNDGASVILVASHEYVKGNNIRPMARILGFASAGVDPRIMGIGPVSATQKLLERCELTAKDFAAIEINEAFAAQVLCVIDLLGLDENKVNPQGGAIALGHPLGCSGARIVTTLIHYLQKNQKDFGLASLCVGVGQGVSMAIQAIN
jgi:acetyl-CoA acetyltransferase family protein